MQSEEFVPGSRWVNQNFQSLDNPATQDYAIDSESVAEDLLNRSKRAQQPENLEPNNSERKEIIEKLNRMKIHPKVKTDQSKDSQKPYLTTYVNVKQPKPQSNEASALYSRVLKWFQVKQTITSLQKVKTKIGLASKKSAISNPSYEVSMTKKGSSGALNSTNYATSESHAPRVNSGVQGRGEHSLEYRENQNSTHGYKNQPRPKTGVPLSQPIRQGIESNNRSQFSAQINTHTKLRSSEFLQIENANSVDAYGTIRRGRSDLVNDEYSLAKDSSQFQQRLKPIPVSANLTILKQNQANNEPHNVFAPTIMHKDRAGKNIKVRINLKNRGLYFRKQE